ncbi:hypothetical protein KR018_011945, partial [Drosophila ironensis]
LICMYNPVVFYLLVVFQGAVVFKFSNVVCKSHNESWVTFEYCRLKAVSRDRVLLNVNAVVLHPANDVSVHVKMWKKASGFKPWLFDNNIDACRFFKNTYDPFFKIVYNIFKDFSNINHTCPFLGPQTVKNFYLRPERLKLPFPSGDYLLTLQWFLAKKPQFDTNVTFIYTEDLL